jgi:polyhydroxyalkanoate synthesis regulator phasin
MAIKLFGFNISRSSEDSKPVRSFVPREDQTDAGAMTVQSGFSGTYLELENNAKSDSELINKYREMAMHPEVEVAVDDITSEAIVHDTVEYPVKIYTNNIESEPLKKTIEKEFNNILKLLKFKERGYDIFRDWYVDGRLFYHIIINDSRPKDGIRELRNIDPRKIKKIKQVKNDKSSYSDSSTSIDIISSQEEYYVYNPKGISNAEGISGLPITVDSICHVTSGLKDGQRNYAVSHLHKAIKPLNQLKLVEDSVVIYRWTRAPERRVFYIDVGNLPKQKAEQYLSEIMTKHKNKIVYDGTTGEVRDDRKHLSMLEDYWFPRREGGRGTEIETLPGGTNLGEMDDVNYFLKKLYKSLNVPLSRLESENSMQLGRAQEISRDEYKFNRFIIRLRTKFSDLFIDLLKKQLILKGHINLDEWKEISQDVIFDFTQDSYYTEIKNSEMLRDRIALVGEMQEYIGKYYSNEWVRRSILKMTSDEIEKMDTQIADEAASDDPKYQQTEEDPQ